MSESAMPEQKSRMGIAAARGYDDGVKFHARRTALAIQLQGRVNIAKRAQGRMAGTEGNDIGPAALRAEICRQIAERRIRTGLIFAFGIGAPGRAQQVVEQHIAGCHVNWIVLRHPLFQLDICRHAEFYCGRAGEAHEIRLHRPGDQHAIGLRRSGGPEIILQLPHLVAAKS